MPLPHLILSISWISFCVLHSVLASSVFKKAIGSMMGKHFHFYRLYYNVFAFLSFAAVVWYQLNMHSYFLYEPFSIGIIIGALIGASGLSIMLICISKYFKTLSGAFHEPEKKDNTVLYIAGIHKYVRHPLYLGTFTFIWGGWIAYPLLSLLISNIIITTYTLIGIGFEEKKLLAFFGDSYKKYQQQVPMIIPRFPK